MNFGQSASWWEAWLHVEENIIKVQPSRKMSVFLFYFQCPASCWCLPCIQNDWNQKAMGSHCQMLESQLSEAHSIFRHRSKQIQKQTTKQKIQLMACTLAFHFKNCLTTYRGFFWYYTNLEIEKKSVFIRHGIAILEGISLNPFAFLSAVDISVLFYFLFMIKEHLYVLCYLNCFIGVF